MNNKVISGIIAGVMLLSVCGCGSSEIKEEKKGQNVSVYTAKVGPIENQVTYTGEIKEAGSVSITSKVSAKAQSIFVKEGDYVEEGTVLAQLDDTDIKLSYQQTEAGYNSAVANYNMIVNSSTKQAKAQAEQAKNSAQIAYDNALSAYNREKALYEQNTTLILAEQSYNDAVAAYNRQQGLFDSNASITAAQNALTSAEQNYERTKQLFDIGAASQLELDNALNALNNARAAYSTSDSGANTQLEAAKSAMVTAEQNLIKARISARVPLETAENTLKSAENALKNAKENINLTAISTNESISTAKASVASAKASLDTAKNTLNNTKIIAPISGFVAGKNMNVGQMVTQGVEIFSIKNSNNVDAAINVTESVISSISIGTEAKVKINSADIEEIKGVVTLVNNVKDTKTGMYSVKVSIDNADDKIKVGMFADIALITEQNEESVIIPTDSLIQEDEDMYVYVVNGEKAEKKLVLVGIQNSKMTEILSGISEGDRVVVSGKEYLSETNNTINITSEDENNEEE